MGEGRTGSTKGGVDKVSPDQESEKPAAAQFKSEESKVDSPSDSQSAEATPAAKALPETQEAKAQKEAADAEDSRRKEVSGKHVETGTLPDTTVVGGEKKAERTEVKLEDLPRLTGDELKRSQYWQKNLTVLLPRIWKVDADLDPEKGREKAQQDIKDLVARIEEESKAGKFGPASQEAYRRFVDWYEQDAVPGTVKALDNLGIAIPPGCPCELLLNENGRPIQPDLFKSLVGIDKVKFQSQLDTTRVPSDENLDAIERGLSWLDASNTRFEETTNAHQERLLTELIKNEGLPSEWLKKPGDDPKAWLQSASEMVDLASRTKNYVEAMHSLYKSAPGQDFPFKLPPGTEIVIDIKGVKHTIRAGEEEASAAVISDKNGTMASVKFDLPLDLRQEHLSNSPKIERMREWLNSDHTKKVEQALGEYLKYQQRPEAVLMYGDQEIPDSPGHDYQGRFNEKGELLGIVDATEYRAKPGERVQNINLLDYDFQSSKTDDGRILVEQTIQGWEMSKYAYQNIRAFGDRVGKPMPFTKPVPPDFDKNYEKFEIKVNGETRTLYKNKTNESDTVELIGDGDNRQLKEVKLYNPNDFVVVRNGSHTEIRKANQLEAFRSGQRNSYYFEKGLAVGLDVAMLASAATGIGAVALGSRAAVAGVQLTGRQIAWEISKSTMRATVAGAGVFNNAGAREEQWGRDLNTARGIYFLADISQGLLRGGINRFRAARAGETMSSAEKVHSIIYGTGSAKAVDGAKAFEGLGWIKKVDRTANIAFRVTEAGFVPVVGRDLYEQFKAINEKGARNPLEDAMVQIGDGRGLQKPAGSAFDMKNASALEGASTVLDGYRQALSSGKPETTRAKVAEILDRTKELLDPARAGEREAFKQSLMENVTFTEQEIVELEQARRPSLPSGVKDSAYYDGIRLSGEDLSKLLDPARRHEVQPPEVARLAQEILDRKDKDVRACSLIALTYLSRDADGNVSDTLVSAQQNLPEYKTTVLSQRQSQGGSYETTREIAVTGRQVDTSISAKEAITLLNAELEAGSNGSRGIATGDILLRLGAITHRQYGGILQDVLNDPKSSAQDKMKALVDPSGARFATIIDGARYEDSQGLEGSSEAATNREIGKRFGLTSADMLRTLEKTASDPGGDPDVKAMATTLLYGLSERDVTRRGQILKVANDWWQNKEGKLDGSYANEITGVLKRDMETEISAGDADADLARERKLNAALAVARITSASDAAAQAKINESIAHSFSTTDGDLAVKVLDALLPDRIKQLEKDNPAAAAELRRQAVEMIKLPADLKQERTAVKLLERMPALFNLEPGKAFSDTTKQTQAQMLALTLRTLIDAKGGRQYAQWFPDLRRAAIDSLAAFGDRSAADLIRAHIAQSGSQKIGDRTIEFNEPDARVRVAAIKALQVLKDDDLAAHLPRLLQAERDPDVARELRDVRFLAEQIEPDSPKWDEIKEKYTEKLAFTEKLAARLGSSTFNYEDFLRENKLELLDSTKFSKEANAEAVNSWGFFDRFNPFGESRETMEKNAIARLEDRRMEQFQQLVELAKRSDSTGLKAKVTLFQIIEKQGGALGKPGDMYVVGDCYQGNRTNPDWAKLSADAFKEISKEGYGDKDFTKWAVRNALENNMTGSNSEAMNALLDGWKSLHQSGTISKEEYAGTLAVALRGQLDKAVNATEAELKGSENIQKRLLKELAESKHRAIFPIFDAVAHGVGEFKGSRFESVCQEAGRLLSDFQDSVNLMWDNTQADTSATAEARAERVRKALQGEKKVDPEGNVLQQASAEKTVQEIFNAYKGVKISTENDPGLPYLYKALGSENERVRLAAAKVIAESDLPHDSFTKETALKTLLDLAEKGSRPRYKEDAEAELMRMKAGEFGSAANVTKEVLLDGVGWLRNGVKEFPESSDGKRAEHIYIALADNRSAFNHEDTAKAIFEATRGRQIVSENDARREALAKALEHEHERVRLAAAWSLSESAVPADRDAAVKVLSAIATDSENPRRMKEAQQILKEIILFGNEEDQKRAHEAWKESWDKRKMDEVEPPSAIPDAFTRRTAYFSRAPLGELNYVIENANLLEKVAIYKAMTGASDAQVAEFLKPAPVYDINSRMRYMNTQNCISGHHRREEPKLDFATDWQTRTLEKEKQEEGKLDDFFRNAMEGFYGPRASSDMPVWTPAQKTERPQLSGRNSNFRLQSFGKDRLLFPSDRSPGQIDKESLEALTNYLREIDKQK